MKNGTYHRNDGKNTTTTTTTVISKMSPVKQIVVFLMFLGYKIILLKDLL